MFKKKVFVYLRSSGHEEYKYILGSWAVGIYQFMYRIVTSQSNVIVVHPRLYQGKKSFLAEPSKLDNLWFAEHKIEFVYVFNKILPTIESNVKIFFIS